MSQQICECRGAFTRFRRGGIHTNGHGLSDSYPCHLPVISLSSPCHLAVICPSSARHLPCHRSVISLSFPCHKLRFLGDR
jgi:hypothetical protein